MQKRLFFRSSTISLVESTTLIQQRSKNSYDEEPYGSPAVLGSHFPPPSAAEALAAAAAAPAAVAVARFEVGTPQSHLEFMASHENSNELGERTVYHI